MMLMITPCQLLQNSVRYEYWLSPLCTLCSRFQATATRGRPLGKLRPKRNLESRHLPQSVHVPSGQWSQQIACPLHTHVLIYLMFQTGHSQMDDAINR